jgi:hypothetical protein
MARKARKALPGTWVERTLFESKAFLALRGLAPQVLILILAKRNFDYVKKGNKEERILTNGDSLIFTYLEAQKKYGISKPRLTRAFDELLAKGFLKVQHQGGAYKQDKTIYALTHEWAFWSKGVVFSKREKDCIGRGYRKPKRKK